MLERIWLFVLSLIPSLVVAVIAAWVTVKFSLKQFRSERWWEGKRDAYARVLSALYDGVRYCKFKSADAKNYVPTTDIVKQLNDETERRFRDAALNASDEVQRAIAIGEFYLSDRAVSILDNLMNRPAPNWEQTPHWEIFDADRDAYEMAIRELRIEAKQDLKMTTRWPSLFPRLLFGRA